MARPVIALDIDDVLVPTDEYVVSYLEKTFGCTVPPAQERSLKPIAEVVALTGRSEREVSAAVQTCLLSPEFAELPPMTGARGALVKLAQDYELVTITARSPEFQEPTRIWVREHFAGLITEMYFPNGFALTTEKFVHVDKNAALLDTGACWLIDDSPSHFDFEHTGIKGILFGDYPWNREYALPEGTVRVGDWTAVLRTIQAVEGSDE